MSERDPILPGTGRGTAREARGGGGSPSTTALAESPLHHPTDGPPPRAGEELRRDFPGLVNADGSPWHYLDSAATAQKPQAVIDTVTRAIGADYATVHRGVYTRSADGHYTFLGRNSDMIKAGGIWVSPAEVESVLIEHPDVLEAAVVGARDDAGLEMTVVGIIEAAVTYGVGLAFAHGLPLR